MCASAGGSARCLRPPRPLRASGAECQGGLTPPAGTYREAKEFVVRRLATGYSGTSLQRSAVPLAVFTLKQRRAGVAGAASLLWLGDAATLSAASGTAGGVAALSAASGTAATSTRVPVVQSSPACSSVSETASPRHAAKTGIHILRIEADRLLTQLAKVTIWEGVILRLHVSLRPPNSRDARNVHRCPFPAHDLAALLSRTEERPSLPAESG